MSFRGAIPDFQLANPIYIGASVSFYEVDDDGARTDTLATLYAAPTGSTTVSNPQTLDGDGKLDAPVYIAEPVIAVAVGPNVASHETGVIAARGKWRGDWVTATVYYVNDFVKDAATGEVYVVADDYTSGASVAADVSATHIELVFDPSEVVDDLLAGTLAYRSDISGAIATGGTSSAYTVTTSQGYAALAAGIMVAFTPHTTNVGATTLALDGLTAKPLRTVPGSTGNLTDGTLIEGTPYRATYKTSNGGEWILNSFFGNPNAVPLGTVLDYAGATAPSSNFVLCYGQAISRSTYATLFDLISTTYGVGDGSSTFNVPDCRGRVVAGQDDMGGVSANRLTGVTGSVDGDTLGGTGGAETHTLTSAEMPSHTHTATSVVTDPGHTHTFGGNNAAATGSAVGGSSGTSTTNSNTTGITVATTNANTGGGGAHNNVQPTIILNKIIRVL